MSKRQSNKFSHVMPVKIIYSSPQEFLHLQCSCTYVQYIHELYSFVFRIVIIDGIYVHTVQEKDDILDLLDQAAS